MKTPTEMIVAISAKTSATARAALIGGLLVATSAVAAESVDESRPASAEGRIEFSGVTGDFEIIGHDAAEWLLSGSLGEDVKELVIEGGPDDWQIRLEMKEGRSGRNLNRTSSDLKLLVPRASELAVRTVSGDLWLRQLEGRSVDARTVSGDLELVDVTPQRLTVSTVSGDLSASGSASEVNRIKSVSGDVEASGAKGRVELESVSGDFDVEGSAISELSIETVSGDVVARIRPTERSRLDISSHSGDVELLLPADSGVRVDAETFSGSISSAFGGDVRSGRGPGESLSMESGSAGVEIEASTFSGNVRIRHLD